MSPIALWHGAIFNGDKKKVGRGLVTLRSLLLQKKAKKIRSNETLLSP
jgi:hypothetical protein